MAHALGQLEVLFWSLQSLVWDDYLALPECRQAIHDVAQWYATWAGPGSPVLDVGCGTGNYTLALAELGYEVVGLDLAEGMLTRARAKTQRVPGCRAQFRRANLNQGLPFPRSSFDGVLCVAVLQCAHDPVAFLQEVWRVLRPGGHFLLLFLDSSRRSRVKQQLRSGMARRGLRWIKALGSHTHRARRYDHDELLELLEQAGFRLRAEQGWEGSLGFLSAVPAGDQAASDKGGTEWHGQTGV